MELWATIEVRLDITSGLVSAKVTLHTLAFLGLQLRDSVLLFSGVRL